MIRDVVLVVCVLASGLDFTAFPDPPAAAGESLVPHGIENRGLTCVALAVYSEARGESWFGQALVAQVVINRQALLPYGSDACDVVLAPGQFAGVEGWTYPRHPWSDDARAWALALDVATAVTSGDYYVPPPCQRATYFKARDPRSAPWGNLKLLCTVGGHDFFGEPDSLVAATATGRRPT